MGNFDRDDRRGGGGRRGFSSRGGYGGRDFGGRSDRQMHKAICSNCGKECEVPFRPTGAKPVFCSECFEKRNRDSGRESFGGRGPRHEPPQHGEQFSVLNAKLDKILAMLTPGTLKLEEEAEGTEQSRGAKGPELIESEPEGSSLRVERPVEGAAEEKPKKKTEKVGKKKKVTKKKTSEETDSLV